MRWLRLFIVWVLSALVVSAFLSHWSLADGAPRNSLQMFLDGQAHRPFAYRLLAPALVNAAEEALPAPARRFLADDVAPAFRARYVAPLLPIYEAQIPGITERAHQDWAQERYRASYVLMVALMLCSLAGAMLLLHRAVSQLGAGEWAAMGAVAVYGLMVPTLFLNGGYFYDFTEQLGAVAFICCVLEKRWVLSAGVLFLMQFNKETAVLMPLFLAFHFWQWGRWQGLRWGAFNLLMCVLLLMAVRLYGAHWPGQSSEWHLDDNLTFWFSVESWRRTTDFHALGVALPRCVFLCFALAALVWGWKRGATANVIAATIAFGVLSVLLLTMGFTDEYRNISLALPLLILVLFEKRGDKGVPQRSIQAL